MKSFEIIVVALQFSAFDSLYQVELKRVTFKGSVDALRQYGSATRPSGRGLAVHLRNLWPMISSAR
ncbi:MAG TPA: hypothetical protein VNZ64_19195 [Candidatus Acidoferrum sp.]|jgi:hypothetical protein|nr:hypothetical protein [Candidatus Acidoferrum sp.]